MRRTIFCFIGVVLFIVTFFGGASVYSHCQIPCGIYGDQGRFDLMDEHIRTIALSIDKVNSLSAEDELDGNQLVRWVENKEHHADELSEIITWYFMAQRIKPVAAGEKGHKKYISQLTTLHKMLVYCMKAKQSAEAGNADKLYELLGEFEQEYPAK